MLSEFRMKKLNGEIERWDFDGDGVVEREDFDLVAKRVVELIGIKPGSAEQQRAIDAYAAIWDTWWAPADTDNDGRVTADEYMVAAQYMDQMPRDQVMTSGARIIGAAFDALDLDADGAIGPDEWKAFVDAQHGDTDRADEAWSRLDTNRNGRISRDEFAAMMLDYYVSDDPEAPGNWIFGTKYARAA